MPTNFSKQSMRKTILLTLSIVTIGSSAIFGFADQAQARRNNVVAGPIWNNADAKVKCPVAAAAVNRQWNGQWKTTVPGKKSICGLK